MAPKVAKKERAKPTKKVKSELESMSESRHNMAAYLQPEGSISPEFTGIMEYLHRARINYAITTQHVAYQSHIKAFWSSAVIETVENKEVIRATAAEKPVVITENTIRERLRLGDQPEDPTSIDLQCQRGLLMRLRYSDDVLANQINKKYMPLRYKFLLHILIHFLSNKRSGFLQMMIDDQIPDLPKAEADVLPVNPMNERTLLIFKSMAAYKESDPIRKLIGHLNIPGYEAPQNNRWRRDASDSDNEEPRLIALADTQLGAKHGIKAKRKSAGSSSAAARVEVDVNVAAEEVQEMSVDPDVRVGTGGDGGAVVVETGGSTGGDGGDACQSGTVATDKGKGKVDQPRKRVDESSSSSEEEGGSDGDDSSSEDDNPPPPGMRKVFDKRGNPRFVRIKKTGSTGESDQDEDYTLTSPGFL
ncbi:hypothetical protein HanIR_Chr09g0410461 [Helianthus annuus]|nr:hypothetical protein HanIR_Chr09g0410461 [Helianthus annuus]